MTPAEPAEQARCSLPVSIVGIVVGTCSGGSADPSPALSCFLQPGALLSSMRLSGMARAAGQVGDEIRWCRQSAAVEPPLVEAAVHVGFKASWSVQADGLASIEGDERVLAPPPRVRHALYFRHRLEADEVQ